MLKLEVHPETANQLSKKLEDKSAIYILASDKAILYIGKSRRLSQRIYQHLRWLKELSSQSKIYIYFRYCDESRLIYFERKLIKKYRPIHNKSFYEFSGLDVPYRINIDLGRKTYRLYNNWCKKYKTNMNDEIRFFISNRLQEWSKELPATPGTDPARKDE